MKFGTPDFEFFVDPFRENWKKKAAILVKPSNEKPFATHNHTEKLNSLTQTPQYLNIWERTFLEYFDFYFLFCLHNNYKE